MRVVSLTHDDIEKSCRVLKEKIEAAGKKYIGVYPVLRGGYYPAVVLSRILGIPMMYQPGNQTKEILIIDDIVDSGRTLEPYKQFDTAVVVDKRNREDESRATYEAIQVDQGQWVEFPWEDTRQDMENIVVRQLQAIGEDSTRIGLKDTPERVVRMWTELFRGYDKDQLPKVTAFPNGMDGITYDQMVVDTGDFYSQCEHHMVPFFGKYWFAYIPAEKGLVVGLSKIARVVDYYSARLQIQERLVSDVVSYIEKALKREGVPEPLGIAMVMKGEHLCKTMRGAKKRGVMTTSHMTGVFKDDPTAKAEFLDFVNNGNHV